MKESSASSRLRRRLKIFWLRNYATLTVGSILLLLGVYALHIEPHSLRITEEEVISDRVTPQMDGLVIAFIADIHLNHDQMQHLPRTIEIINRRQPDIILLGGDFVNGNGSGPGAEVLMKYLQKLSAPLGVYAVPGNHDYRRGVEPLRNAFAGSRIKLLQDQNVIIELPGGEIFNLIGLDYKLNPHEQSDPERLSKLIRSGSFNLLLTHTPADFALLTPEIDLALAGHTHGGQLNIPLLGSFINPVTGRKFSYGMIRENGQYMFVTCGLGSAYTPARLAMMPEVVFITLKNRPEN